MANASPMPVPILQDFKTESGVLGWIDVLNVQKMQPERLEELFSIMSDFSVRYSKMGFTQNVTIQSVNSLLVGDTLCLAQVDHSLGSRFMTAQTAIMFSQKLFAEGFAHRGVVTLGAYEAKHPEGGLPYIIGKAVIDAFTLEKDLKVSGLTIEENALNLVAAFRDKNIGNEMIRTKTKTFGSYFLSSKLHLQVWKQFASQHWDDHPYIAAAKAITDQHDNWTE